MMARGIRTNNNERVYEEAERIAYLRAANGRARGTGLRAVSEHYVKQRDKLFAHLLTPRRKSATGG